MTQMLFYERVVALDKVRHANVKLRQGLGFGFAAKANSLPIVAGEFVEASRDLPIVFVRGTPEGPCLPAVLVGLRDHENLLVDAQGQWGSAYIPAFVRRYPFAPGDAGEDGNTVVCIDEQAPMIDLQEGAPLFVDGQPSDTLQQALTLMREYQEHARRTQALCTQLDRLGLLTDANADATLGKDVPAVRLSGFQVVDETRLQALDRDAVFELFTSGDLGLIHAHLLSLGNIRKLSAMLAARQA